MQNYKRQLARWIGCCAVGWVLSALGQGQASVAAPAKLAALQQVAASPALHTITVQPQTSSSKLFYNTTLSPLTTGTVLSPVDGTVVKIYFNYGSRVKAGQNLFALNSDKLADDYRQAIQDYLAKKQDLNKNKLAVNTDKQLFDAGAESRENYQQSKTTYENSVIALQQARQKLSKVLNVAGVEVRDIEALSLDDTSQVQAVLNRKFDHLIIKSKSSGVALFPDKSLQIVSSDSGSTSGQKLQAGSAVKQDQLLLAVGDLTGLSAKIQVSEVNIDRVHAGQKVEVTGDAFPGIKLPGVVQSVSSQAGDGDSGGFGGSGLSMFDVTIKIPKVSRAALAKIRVGMTAKVSMDVANPSRVMLPLQAVHTKDGQSFVTVLLDNGQTHAVPVVTGTTTPDGKVTIVQGLRGGQKVVLPGTSNQDQAALAPALAPSNGLQPTSHRN